MELFQKNESLELKEKDKHISQLNKCIESQKKTISFLYKKYGLNVV